VALLNSGYDHSRARDTLRLRVSQNQVIVPPSPSTAHCSNPESYEAKTVAFTEGFVPRRREVGSRFGRSPARSD